MEIEVTQEKLSRALNNVSRIAMGRVTLPVLNNVLIRVDNKKVSLTTTNLDMAVVDFLPTSKSKNGTVTVPAKLLADFVSSAGSAAELLGDFFQRLLAGFQLFIRLFIFTFFMYRSHSLFLMYTAVGKYFML